MEENVWMMNLNINAARTKAAWSTICSTSATISPVCTQDVRRVTTPYNTGTAGGLLAGDLEIVEDSVQVSDQSRIYLTSEVRILQLFIEFPRRIDHQLHS
jgi:hypothetical protein